MTYSLSPFLKSSKLLEDLHKGHLSKLAKEAKFQAKRRRNFDLIPIFASLSHSNLDIRRDVLDQNRCANSTLLCLIYPRSSQSIKIDSNQVIFIDL